MAPKETKELTKAAPQETSMSQNMTVADLLAQRSVIKEAMQKVMVRDVDYGRVGNSDKDALLQAGAQKLCMIFRLAPVFESKEIFDGNHITVKSTCTIKHAPSGTLLGSGEGLCSSKEKKYAKRKEGGRIVENANLADVWNTVLKMSNKRGLVAAVLNVTAAGDIFTQDTVDEKDDDEDGEKKPEQKEDEPKTVAAAVKDTVTAKETKPKTNGNGNHEPEGMLAVTWKGQIKGVVDLTLPGGRDAWAIIGADDTEFKTTNKNFSGFAKEAAGKATIVAISHHKNGNNSNVIDQIVAAKEVVTV